MIHVRDGDGLILHGNANNRLLSHIASGAEACINVALVDALRAGAADRRPHHALSFGGRFTGGGSEVEDERDKQRLMNMVFGHAGGNRRYRICRLLLKGYLRGHAVDLVHGTGRKVKLSGPDRPRRPRSGPGRRCGQGWTPLGDERTQASKSLNSTRHVLPSTIQRGPSSPLSPGGSQRFAVLMLAAIASQAARVRRFLVNEDVQAVLRPPDLLAAFGGRFRPKSCAAVYPAGLALDSASRAALAVQSESSIHFTYARRRTPIQEMIRDH